MSNQNALLASLDRFLSGKATSAELLQINDAILEGKIDLVVGTRGVAIDGNASNSVIVTGDNNVTVNISTANSDIAQRGNEIIEDSLRRKGAKHFCLQQSAIQVYNRATDRGESFLRDYVKIVISKESQVDRHSRDSFFWREQALYEKENFIVVYMNANLYDTVEKFFNDLYLYYVRDQYRPYTYGKDWILTQIGNGLGFLAVPWQWLINRSAKDVEGRHQKNRHAHLHGGKVATSLNDIAVFSLSSNIRNYHPRDFGLIPDSYWYIAEASSISAVGIATYDEECAEMLATADAETIKGVLSAFAYEVDELRLENGLLLKVVAANEIADVEYVHKFIFEDSWWWKHNNGIAIIARRV